MKKIVLTGGPCAGKSEVLKFIREEYLGKLLAMNEVASTLFDNLFPLAGRDVSFSEEWLILVQQAVLPVQRSAEQAWGISARESGISVLLMDRGIMDSAAYVGGVERFAQEFAIDVPAVNASYAMVIHLESLATGNPALFETARKSNPHRRETLEQTMSLEVLTREAWSGHPNWHLVPNRGSLAELRAHVLELLSPYLDNEVERKFLLPKVPAINLGEGVPVQQGYIITEPGEMRIRRMGTQYFFAVKGDGDISRAEWERPYLKSLFDLHWPNTVGRRIDKTRYFIPHGHHKIELDIYHGSLAGLVTFECEFDSEEQAAAFELPDWAADAVEVTDDKQYKNKRLAQFGLPIR